MRVNLNNLVYLLLLVLSIAISALGIYKNPSILSTSWVHQSSEINLVNYSVGYFCVCLLGYALLRARVLKFLIFAGSIFCLFVLGITNFFVPIVFFYSSSLLGYLILDFYKLRDLRFNFEISLLIGLAFFSLATYLLSLSSYNTVQLYSLVLVIPFLLSPKKIPSVFYMVRENLLGFANFSMKEVVIFACMIWGVSIHLHQAFRPEFDFDALAAHLMIPHFIKANGFWSFNFNQFVFGANQLGADMLYAFTYVLSGEEGTRFFNFLMFLLVGKLCYEICKMFAGRLVSLVSTLSLILTPLLFTQTTSLHIECVWVAFIFGANIVCLQMMPSKAFTKEMFLNCLVVLAIIAGTALAIKLPTLFYLPFIFFALCISLWRSTFKISEILRGLITPVAVFVVFGLVPYLYCYSLTGNPVFPYFNGIFKSDYFYKSQSFNNPIFNQSLSYRTLYDMTFHGSWYLESLDHPISLTYLMFFAPIVYFIIQNIRKLKIILIACQVFLAAIGIYIFQSYFRYLLPSLVLYVVLIAALIEYLKTNQRQIYQISMFSIFLSLPISVIHIPDPTHNYKEFSWEKAIAREVEEDRLLRRPQQVVFDYLNSRYGTKATVFHIQQPLTAGLDGLSLVSVWYNPELSRRISLLKSMQDVKTLVKTYGITHFVSYSNDVSNEFVKSFLVSTTDIEMEHSNMTLYKVDFRKLPSANLLDAANIVSNVVSVELKESRNYLITQDFGSDLIMEGRDYVTVLNWLDRSGKSLDMRYIFERVSRQASYFDYFLRAPEEATTLVISLPTIDSKSFKDYQIQLVTIGDQTLIPSYQGD